MSYLAVVAAGAAAWIFGAVWYGVIGRLWMKDVGLSEETINRKDPIPYIGSFLCAVVVAGMTRHIFATSNVESSFDGLVSGLGLGLFIATPWVATNYLFSQRPYRLILWDGIYATAGCTVIGFVLMMF